MRVLWILSGLAMGGAERNVVSLLPYLRECGAEVCLCTLNTRRDGPLAEAFLQTGLQRFELGARRMTDPAAWRRFSALLDHLRPDLLHAADQDSIIYAALARRFLRVPAVMTRHVLEEPATNLKEAARAQLLLWSARHGMERIVAVAEVIRQRFALQARVPLARIETIYNGIDLEHFLRRQPRAEIRRRLGWEAERPIALFISVMRPGKGFEVLFDAVARIRARIPGFQVKLVGEGPLQAALLRQAAPLGEAAEFLGQRTDVPDLLAASDLLIQASWSEALPTVLIEAGAAGLPVVATDVGGSHEIVQDGSGGYLVRAGDAAALAARVVELLESPAMAAQMGSHARERVTGIFSLSRQAEQTLRLYERILATHEDPV